MPELRRIVMLLGLVLGACSRPNSPPTILDTKFAPALEVNLAASTKTPSGLYYRDITLGSWAVVRPGQQVSVQYTGWLANGTQFDSNVGKQPFSFHLGAGEVIQGWEQGVAGMHVGGRRQLIIPPALGYGANGSGPIPRNAILVFDVEVVSIP